ncbi:hypothetical protein, partial [Vibrio breoganii]|uniref:hypothetical protein n=1 Tax=Vibrio breoganii TaxID=553239 RepID=UPI001A7E1533
MSKNYVSVRFANEKKAVRLKGLAFTNQFTSLDALNGSEYEKPLEPESTVEELKAKFEHCVEQRRIYNQRFQSASSTSKALELTPLPVSTCSEKTQPIIPMKTNDGMPSTLSELRLL